MIGDSPHQSLSNNASSFHQKNKLQTFINMRLCKSASQISFIGPKKAVKKKSFSLPKVDNKNTNFKNDKKATKI